jgi:hypothetical protein
MALPAFTLWLSRCPAKALSLVLHQYLAAHAQVVPNPVPAPAPTPVMYQAQAPGPALPPVREPPATAPTTVVATVAPACSFRPEASLFEAIKNHLALFDTMQHLDMDGDDKSFFKSFIYQSMTRVAGRPPEVYCPTAWLLSTGKGRLSPADEVKFGAMVSSLYRTRKGALPAKHSLIVDGRVTSMNTYTIDDIPILEAAWEGFQGAKK